MLILVLTGNVSGEVLKQKVRKGKKRFQSRKLEGGRKEGVFSSVFETSHMVRVPL
jgi:hypothetical protein